MQSYIYYDSEEEETEETMVQEWWDWMYEYKEQLLFVLCILLLKRQLGF